MKLNQKNVTPCIVYMVYCTKEIDMTLKQLFILIEILMERKRFNFSKLICCLPPGGHYREKQYRDLAKKNFFSKELTNVNISMKFEQYDMGFENVIEPS